MRLASCLAACLFASKAYLPIPVAQEYVRETGYDEVSGLPRSDSQFSLTEIVIEENTMLKQENQRLAQMVSELGQQLERRCQHAL